MALQYGNQVHLASNYFVLLYLIISKELPPLSWVLHVALLHKQLVPLGIDSQALPGVTMLEGRAIMVKHPVQC